MKKEKWLVTESSTRPAGKPDRCFYCGQLIGEQHKEDCVIRSKTVVVDFTFRTVLSVPECWDEEQICLHYNDGSWCADNILSELDGRSEKMGCNCDIYKAKFIRDADERDEEKYGVTYISEKES
ncbi:hypothetical protein [Konateibacter massiliensis]|uniref:hypothetical protein n=1 Tax=Konateibacter massiliensis TaxID=2002841 RepID=UPI000C144946|nr:hypothetical protein [Konateibacter massiliensis]